MCNLNHDCSIFLENNQLSEKFSVGHFWTRKLSEQHLFSFTHFWISTTTEMFKLSTFSQVHSFLSVVLFRCSRIISSGDTTRIASGTFIGLYGDFFFFSCPWVSTAAIFSIEWIHAGFGSCGFLTPRIFPRIRSYQGESKNQTPTLPVKYGISTLILPTSASITRPSANLYRWKVPCSCFSVTSSLRMTAPLHPVSLSTVTTSSPTHPFTTGISVSQRANESPTHGKFPCFSTHADPWRPLPCPWYP